MVVIAWRTPGRLVARMVMIVYAGSCNGGQLTTTAKKVQKPEALETLQRGTMVGGGGGGGFFGAARGGRCEGWRPGARRRGVNFYGEVAVLCWRRGVRQCCGLRHERCDARRPRRPACQTALFAARHAPRTSPSGDRRGTQPTLRGARGMRPQACCTQQAAAQGAGPHRAQD